VGDLSPSEHLKLTYRVLIVLKFGGEDYYVDDDDDSSHPWSVSRDGARRPGPAARFTPTSSESRPPATESSSIKGIELSHLILSSPLHESSQAAKIKASFAFAHQDCHVGLLQELLIATCRQGEDESHGRCIMPLACALGEHGGEICGDFLRKEKESTG
jgi:hypothetical protein